MASGKITKRSVDALISIGAEGILWDDSLKGFGAKITKSGAVSYILQFRMGGREARTRRYTIGSHGSPWTPTTARDEAERLSLLIAQGIDPVEVEKQRRREAVDLAFNNYADRFEKACVGKGWQILVERSFRIHVMPVLGAKPLPKITRADGEQRQDYREVIARLVERGAEAIVLGCTEIMLLVGADDSAVPLFDTTALHAAAAVDLALAGD